MEKPKNDLFKSDGGGMYTARINHSLDRWYLTAFGFEMGIDAIAEKIASDITSVDGLFLPLAYLSRHYVELCLKILLRDCNCLIDKPDPIPTHHDLLLLWRELRPMLEEISPDENPNDLNRVESVISDFNSVDQGSYSFRYPTDKKDQPTLDGLTHVNVPAFYEKISSVRDFFNGAMMATSEYRSVRDSLR